MKLLLVAAPILAFGAFVAAQSLRGRRISSPNLRASVALLLLVYAAGTAGVGLFWVAKMALPKLDLHYTLGYCMIVLTLWHVILQARVLSAFFRRNSPKVLLSRNGRQFRTSVRRTFWAIVALLAALPIAWVVSLEFMAPARGVIEPTLQLKSNADTAGRSMKMWIARGDKRQSAIEYLYDQGSNTRVRPLARALHVLRVRRLPNTPEPPSCKPYQGAVRVALAAPRPRAGVSLQEAFERGVRGAERIPTIPEPDQPPASTALAGVTLDSVAQVLYYAAGITSARTGSPDNWHRAAPSAGARYPTDVYVAARRVEGLEPGLYYYHPNEHALALVANAAAVEKLLATAATSAQIQSAAATFVLGTTFDRTVSRYNTHGFRYVTIDAGHIGGNLKLAAAAVGIQCGLEPLFSDEALLSALGADRQSEGALLMMPCSLADGSGAEGASPSATSVPEHSLLPTPADPDLVEITRLSYDLTSWRLLPGRPSAAPPPMPPPIDSQGEGTPIALPAATDAERDVFETIHRRRSFRRFSANAVSLSDFAGVLRDALSLAPSTRGQRLIRLYVAVSRVEGLEPGVYEYLPDQHSLALLQRGDTAEQLEVASFSQQVLGRAGFVLIWAMQTPLVERLDGVRGYRHALVDSGIAGSNAYLSSGARGLGICGVGAFDNDRVNSMIGAERSQNWAVYLMGVGRRD